MLNSDNSDDNNNYNNLYVLNKSKQLSQTRNLGTIAMSIFLFLTIL